MVKKASAPNTPQETKSTFKVQSEQRQSAKQNKNKRKSLPANLVNSNGSPSPKKPKAAPFSGTSDLFMQMKQEPKVEDENVESKNSQQDDSKPDSGSRAKRRRERLKAKRGAAKQKIKQTLVDAATGNDAAIARLKERISDLQSKDALSSSANRKLRKLKKVLREAGVSLPSIPEKQVKQNLSKTANKKAQKGKKIDNGNQKKVIKQEKKPQTKSEVKEEPETDEDEDDSEDGMQPQKKGIKKDEPESDEEEDDSEDGEEEEESDDSILNAESMEVEGEEGDSDETEEEGEDSDEKNEEDDGDENEDADSDEDEEEEQKTQKGKPGKQPQIKKFENQANNVSSLEKSKSRYVVFVGNLPFDITKEEISQHFAKVGNVKDIRIPLDKQTNKCRGFAYVELQNQANYEKALSLHHTSVKGRRINVLYTQGGKKKGDEKKQEIKVKNLKLQAMRQEGKLAGSVKHSQKRAARREKKNKAGKAN